MRARIEWTGERSRLFLTGKVIERYPCVRVWEDGSRDEGCMVRNIWWNFEDKGVAHHFEWLTDSAEGCYED